MTFRLHCCFLVLLSEFLGSDSTGETQLNCTFEKIDHWTMWPQYKRCLVTNVNLSNQSEHFKFLGSASRFQQATSVHLDSCSGAVERIPFEIFEQFPNLNGFEITNSKIPILKNDLFSNSKFHRIQYLYLGWNEIEIIEVGAFAEIKKLKWIAIWNNKLTSLNANLFEKNSKIEFIGLQGNQINSVLPSLFLNLSKLKYIQFYYNTCFNGDVGCKTCSITQQQLDEKFQNCYANYAKETFSLN